ncbi:MAG: hypothetical protein KatS3mg027_1268 [Bacteroidia bacterium]|nr:MAG: hypothetical protein KatS3mg027_1268 [Bacteroidia bacterium]
MLRMFLHQCPIQLPATDICTVNCIYHRYTCILLMVGHGDCQRPWNRNCYRQSRRKLFGYRNQYDYGMFLFHNHQCSYKYELINQYLRQSVLCSGQTTTLTANGATSYTWSTGDNTPSVVLTPTSSTSYSVIGINGTCTGTALINVTVNNNPTVSVTPSSATVQITGRCVFVCKWCIPLHWVPSPY